MAETTYTCLTLFSGLGGGALGFQWGGFELLAEGQRALDPTQTRAVRAELRARGVAPTTRTVRHDTWELDLELDDLGAGRARVVLPRDPAACGTLTWRPRGAWIERGAYSQEREPKAEAPRRSNGGRAEAARLLAQLG